MSSSKNHPPKQPPDPRRNDNSPAGQLDITSIKDLAQLLMTFLGHDSVARISAGANILGDTAAAAGRNVVGELRPPGTAKGSTDWYEMVTEGLGFESLTEKADQSSLNIPSVSSPSSSRMTRMYGVMGEKTNFNNIPPFLSTLDSSGRSRFFYEKLRSEGRLTMSMVETNKPEIVRTVGDQGELVIKMVTSHDPEDSDHEDKKGKKKKKSKKKNK